MPKTGRIHKYTEAEAVVRAVRACVRDHMDKDPYDYEPLDQEDLKYHLMDRRDFRELDKERPGGWKIPCVTVEEILRAGAYDPSHGEMGDHDPTKRYAVLGTSRIFDTKYSRPGCIVVRIRYGRMAMADYEVGCPRDEKPSCWQD